jgi:hypothetical protein
MSNNNWKCEMRKYSKYVVVAGALAALAAPTAAMADAPNGTYNIVPKANANASLIGQESSQIKQNGQFVSGNSGVMDQTTTPGSRAALVQGQLALDGQGSLAK